MSADTRMRAAVALVTVAQVFRTDGQDGRDRTDLAAAGAEELRDLFEAGPEAAVMTLVGLIDLAVTYAAGEKRRSRESAWQIVASTAIDIAGGTITTDLIDP